jgi:hypothetical protein
MTTWIKSYGVITCGLELMCLAWPSLEHKFSVRRNHKDIPLLGAQAPPKVVKGHHHFKRNLLVKNPMDLLLVEQGYLKSPPTTFQ